MKVLWRISNHCDLDGLGGERSNGRWHSAARGKRVVYLAEHPALALVEVLANMGAKPRIFPEHYQLMKVLVPESIIMTDGDISLHMDWRNDFSRTRALGDQWLAEGKHALFVVPSAPTPESWNYLLNSRHLDAKQIEIDWCRWVKYDQRLFHTHD